MKRLAFILGTIILAVSCATAIPITDANREVNNFVFNNGTVTWQNVYQFKEGEYDAVRDWFSNSFKITKESEKSLIGETNQNALPIVESGLNRMSVIMLLTHPCVVYFNTDFKEDRYRVTVNRIIWYPQVGVTTYGITQGVGAMDLNEIALKGNGMSSVFYNTSSAQLNQMLTYMFTPKLNQAKTDDNW